MGSTERAGLLALSLAERLCISKSRVLSTALHVRIDKRSNKMQGHTICFPDLAPQTCAEESLPCRSFVEDSIAVLFVGNN